MPVWNKVSTNPPPANVVLNTKIDYAGGVRNKGKLVFYKGRWWTADMKMSVYYIPTHWSLV